MWQVLRASGELNVGQFSQILAGLGVGGDFFSWGGRFSWLWGVKWGGLVLVFFSDFAQKLKPGGFGGWGVWWGF